MNRALLINRLAHKTEEQRRLQEILRLLDMDLVALAARTDPILSSSVFSGSSSLRRSFIFYQKIRDDIAEFLQRYHLKFAMNGGDGVGFEVVDDAASDQTIVSLERIPGQTVLGNAEAGTNVIKHLTVGGGLNISPDFIELANHHILTRHNGFPGGTTDFLRADGTFATPPAGGSPPTGTGFRHVTGGVEDAAAKLVDTADINNDQVTFAKMQNINANRLLGKATGFSSGDIEEITATGGLSVGGGTLSLDNHDIITKHNGFPGGSTNFLREDGTWSAPPGGGDSVGKRTTDQAITVAGWTDIGGLTFPVTAFQLYRFRAFIIYQSSATTMGVLFGVNGPAVGIHLVRSEKQITVGGTASPDMFSEGILTAFDTPLPNSVAEPAAGTNLLCILEGVFSPNANGTYAMRFNKENVAGTATIKAGSHILYRSI